MTAKRPRYSAPFGAGLVVLSSVFYASYGVWTTLMGNFFGSFTASALRCALVTICLYFVAASRKELQKVNWRRDYKWFLVMLAASAFVSGPLYYAILRDGIGVSLGLAYIGIVIGMFICGKLFMGERFTRDKLLATVLGIAGIVLIFSPNLHLVGWLALSAALASGLATSANMAATKRIPYNGSQSTILVWLPGIIVNAPIAVLLHERTPAIGLHIQWLYLLIYVFASLIASWTFVQGLKLVEAGAAGVLGLLEIVFAVLFGVLFFHEHPGVLVLLGVACIVAAAAIPYIKDYNTHRGTLE
ncbi:MAG TPA: DMT family transporter [Candidatus Saccharimonadales bacterium]|nr:DMT family transporter [Candidatus Saccharimonadales bacterium]